MNVFQLGTANRASHKNLAKSIEQTVPAEVFSTLSPAERARVEAELGQAPLYLWGSKNNRNRDPWSRMNLGDLVIFYTGAESFKYCAEIVGTAESTQLGGAVWGGAGNDIFSLLYSLKKPLEVNLSLERVQEVTGRDDYPRGLARLNDEVSEAIASMIGIAPPAADALHDLDQHRDELERDDIPETEREALRKSRIGQGRFRKALIDCWKGRCAISGVGNLDLLRASHIKPWRDSTNQERLDKFNGILLLPHYDHLFDAGYISFDDAGTILISPELDPAAQREMDIRSDLELTSIFTQHRPYLLHHREHVFRS